jgi:hypothetical protein
MMLSPMTHDQLVAASTSSKQTLRLALPQARREATVTSWSSALPASALVGLGLRDPTTQQATNWAVTGIRAPQSPSVQVVQEFNRRSSAGWQEATELSLGIEEARMHQHAGHIHALASIGNEALHMMFNAESRMRRD